MKNKTYTTSIHPGEILEEEFMKPLHLTQYRLAKEIQVPARRINEVIHGTRGISVDTALRLSRYFGNSAEFWLQLQLRHDLTLGFRKEEKNMVQNISPFSPRITQKLAGSSFYNKD